MSKTTRKERRERNEKIIAQYTLGKELEQIAQEFNVSFSRIYQILRENNVKPRRDTNVPRTSVNTFAILADLQNTTLSYVELAQIHNVTKQRIDQIAQKAKDAGIILPNRTGGSNRRPIKLVPPNSQWLFEWLCKRFEKEIKNELNKENCYD